MQRNLIMGFGFCILGAVGVVAQSVPTTRPQTPPVMLADTQKRPTPDHPQTGTIEGYVYWDPSALQYNHSFQCQGLGVTVSVENPPSGSAPVFERFTSLGSFTNNFKALANVGPYAVCTYAVDHLPVGQDLQVLITAQPSAFAPQATAIVPPTANNPNSPIKMISGKCNNLPPAVPSTSVLGSHWWTCGNHAYNVNFLLQPARSSQLMNGAGGSGLLSGSSAGQAGTGVSQRGIPSSSPTSPVESHASGALVGGRGQAASLTDSNHPASNASAGGLKPVGTLTNADVIKMIEAGIPESVVISSVQSSSKRFDFSGDGCQRLQQARISPAIVAAMGDGSVRPCPQILENTSTATPGSKVTLNPQPWPPRTSATASAGSPGGNASLNPQPMPPGTKGTSLSAAKFAPVKLAPPKGLRKATNPQLSQQNASTIAVLQQQKQAAEQESMAMKVALRSAASAVFPRAPVLSPNSQGNTVAQGLGPEKTQSSSAKVNSSIGHLPAFDSVVLTCATDPTPRILRVSGGQGPSIFTPEAKYNLYTIVGCSFGPSQSGGSAYIFSGNGFKANLNIDFWSDNGITAHLDPGLAGVLDQNNVTLVIAPAGRQEFQKPGFKFYAARGMPAPDGSDQEVQLAYNSIPHSVVAIFNVNNFIAGFDQLPSNATSNFPSFSFQGTPVAGWVFRYAYEHDDRIAAFRAADCFINDVGFNGDPCQQFFAIGFRYTVSPGQWQLKSDTWDLSNLVPGFQISSYQLYVSTLDPASLCGSWDDLEKADAYLDGDWSFNLNTQNQIVVTWPVYRCWNAEFGTRNNMMIQSAYGLSVAVIGPRCVDPWTGQKDQACMNKLKQIPG